MAVVIRPRNCNHAWTARRHGAAGDRGFLPSGSVRATVAPTISSANTSFRCRRVYAFRRVMPVSNEQKAACACRPGPAGSSVVILEPGVAPRRARRTRSKSCKGNELPRETPESIPFVSFVLFVVCATCVSGILPRGPPQPRSREKTTPWRARLRGVSAVPRQPVAAGASPWAALPVMGFHHGDTGARRCRYTETRRGSNGGDRRLQACGPACRLIAPPFLGAPTSATAPLLGNWIFRVGDSCIISAAQAPAPAAR